MRCTDTPLCQTCTYAHLTTMGHPSQPVRGPRQHCMFTDQTNSTHYAYNMCAPTPPTSGSPLNRLCPTCGHPLNSKQDPGDPSSPLSPFLQDRPKILEFGEARE